MSQKVIAGVPSVLDFSYKRGEVRAVTSGGLKLLILPEELRDDFEMDMQHRRTDHAKAVLRAVYGSEQVVTKISSSLRDFLGVTSTEVMHAVGQLATLAGISRWDVEKLHELTMQMGATLFETMVDREPTRRMTTSRQLLQSPALMLAQMIGWREFMSHGKAALVDQRHNKVEGTMEALYSFMDARILVATCGTGDVVMLPVSSQVETCEEAQAWLSGDTVSGFPLPQYFSQGRS